MKRTVELTTDMLAAKEMRFANYLIDLALQYGIGYLIGLIIGLMYKYLDIVGPYELITNMGSFGGLVFSYTIMLFYYFIFEATTQRSPAKFITGTKVITFEGEKPSAGTILKRTFCRMIPFNPFSFLGEVGKGWHDSISDTFVINIKKYEEAQQLKDSFEEIGSEIKE